MGGGEKNGRSREPGSPSSSSARSRRLGVDTHRRFACNINPRRTIHMTAPGNTQNGSTEVASNQSTKILLGIAVGAAVGIGIALSRRKRSRWDAARTITNRVAEHSG